MALPKLGRPDQWPNDSQRQMGQNSRAARSLPVVWGLWKLAALDFIPLQTSPETKNVDHLECLEDQVLFHGNEAHPVCVYGLYIGLEGGFHFLLAGSG